MAARANIFFISLGDSEGRATYQTQKGLIQKKLLCILGRCAGHILHISSCLQLISIILALSANTVFSFASTLFADFSKEVSGKWINCFKLCVAFSCFLVLALILGNEVALKTLPYYVLSGALGLFLADHFLCEAFAKLGSARTLMIFSFAPLFVACWCYLFFGDALRPEKLVAIVFFMACVITISYEKLKEEGHWEIAGLVLAFSGVILDGLANVVTSYGFRTSPTDSIFNVCALRSGGAFIAFLLIGPFIKVQLIENFKKLSPHKRKLAVLASFLGAFMSLSLWISAVKLGDLTTIVALSGATPVLAGVFEVVRGKTKLSKYLVMAFVFFLLGFYFLVIRT